MVLVLYAIVGVLLAMVALKTLFVIIAWSWKNAGAILVLGFLGVYLVAQFIQTEKDMDRYRAMTEEVGDGETDFSEFDLTPEQLEALENLKIGE